MSISSRRFLLGASAALGVTRAAQLNKTVPDRGPALDAEIVKELVIAGHGNLAKTKTLLEKQPSMVYSCWDWGGGDFETALGGAAHMGNRDCAFFLLEHGAFHLTL